MAFFKNKRKKLRLRNWVVRNIALSSLGKTNSSIVEVTFTLNFNQREAVAWALAQVTIKIKTLY